MNDAVPTAPPPKRSRRRFVVGIGLLMLVGLVVAAAATVWRQTKEPRELVELLAALDRDEPDGWRLHELEARRPKLSDDDNAATVVLAVHRAIGGSWPIAGAPSGAPPADAPAPFTDRLDGLPPPIALDAALARDLAATFAGLAPALKEASKLRHLRQGRYPLEWRDVPPGLIGRSDDARSVALFLAHQARHQAHARDLDGALGTCADVVGVARSHGDEPSALAMTGRGACREIAVAALERVLAQGEASPASLETLQQALDAEAAAPLAWYAARGERAVAFATAEGLKEGTVPLAAVGTLPGTTTFGQLSTRAWVNRNEAQLLRLMTAAVEAAKRPGHERGTALADVKDRVHRAIQEDNNGLVMLLMGRTDAWAEALRRTDAQLSCALVALAAERFRLERGAWPARLDELTPKYLALVPLDPFDGKPLRLRRTADGLVVFSVDLDGRDDGGVRMPPRSPTNAAVRTAADAAPPAGDIVFRLWDVPHRRQPAAEALPWPRSP